MSAFFVDRYSTYWFSDCFSTTTSRSWLWTNQWSSADKWIRYVCRRAGPCTPVKRPPSSVGAAWERVSFATVHNWRAQRFSHNISERVCRICTYLVFFFFSAGGPQPAVLQKVNVPVWTNEECKYKYGAAAPGGIVEHFLCAGQAARDSCSVSRTRPVARAGIERNIVYVMFRRITVKISSYLENRRTRDLRHWRIMRREGAIRWLALPSWSYFDC